MTNSASLVSGLLVIAGSGVANGSFAVPEKHIKGWKWEHTWLVYSLFALAILPVAVVLLFVPRVLGILENDPMVVARVAASGLLFGVGSVLFGVSLKRLGIAVTNALISGVVVFAGSLGPLVIGVAHIDFVHLLWLIAGLSLLVLSLILCAAASLSREGALSEKPAAGGKLGLAILVAVLAGFFSSMLNIGFAYGDPLIQRAAAAGVPDALTSMAVWIPALLGGLIFNAGYPAYLIWRHGTASTFFRGSHTAMDWGSAASMGLLWFGSNLLYGYGAVLMGSDGSVYGWALSSGASILVSNTWGAVTGEWSGTSKKVQALMWASTALLILSFVMLVVKRMPG